MFKKFLVVFLVFTLLIVGLMEINQAGAAIPIRVYLNQRLLVFDSPPIIRNGRTLVPMRTIFEALGASVEWIPEGQQIKAQKGDRLISLTINSRRVNNNGTIEEIDTEPIVRLNRTLVPLRFISQALGASVSWDENARTITILSGELANNPIANIVMQIMRESRDDQEIAYKIFNRLARNIRFCRTAIGEEANRPENVLRNRIAMSQGFAALFHTMAEMAGIESEIIRGHSRALGEYRLPGGMRPLREHTWNAVKINGSWRLIDVTLGSGLLRFSYSPQGETLGSVSMYRPFFFMPEPEELLFINFPAEPRWQLVQNLITFEQFRNRPIKDDFFFRLDAELVSHKNGIIDLPAAEMGNLAIRIRENSGRDFNFVIMEYPTPRFVIGVAQDGQSSISHEMVGKLRNSSVTRQGNYVSIRPGTLIPGEYVLKIRAAEQLNRRFCLPIIEYKLRVR